ncbi:sensor histidine kinase [Confluentibacter sediminis]|uniref:sensor histidine kinase n=1 Tax=Confluentibacter sediminis TaxID=2219045 RepID=UPI000DAE8141|nr:ATP-binding protein [Confluentibacter sediminis]
MASKNIYFRIITRVLFLLIAVFCFTYFVLQKQIDFSIYLGIIIVFQVIGLIKFLNNTNRKIAFFFNAVENDDSTIHFPVYTKDKSLKELHKSLNRVNHLIQKVKIENKTQEKYYHTILEHATIGIITLNEKGHIVLANKTSKKLLNYESLTHIQQLKRIDEKLFNLLSQLKPFDQKLIELHNERDIVKLTIKSTQIKIDNEKFLLVIIQNISNELNDNEVDSWVKLFRVLTHEIMNSIAPITSISETLSDFCKTENGLISPSEIKEKDIVDVAKGLDIIQSQGKDLLNFVESYRTLTKIPSPKKDLIIVSSLFEKIRILVSQEIGFEKTKFEINIEPKNLEVFADEKQIIQVLVNLVKNSLQSLNENPNGIIKLSGTKTNLSKTRLQITDNGSGIPPNLLDKIFIPFFTTKEKGTGIGLSLSKHIMRLHGGTIAVKSEVNKGTWFTLEF